MPISGDERPTSDDLFAEADKPRPRAPGAEVSPDAPAAKPSYFLPQDLSGALTHIGAGEFEILLNAVIVEGKRRGQLTTDAAAEFAGTVSEVRRPGAVRSLKSLAPDPRAASNEHSGPSLTTGQTNAVRAAFIAGIKPSTIARQFGISQSAVRKAIASDERQRKR